MGGAVPSTPRNGGGETRPKETAEYLIGTFIGRKSFPLSSDFWQKLLELPLSLHWPSHRVRHACETFAQNNYYTRHLAKIFIHLACCLQECIASSGAPSSAHFKALNAAYISSIFLKYIIENAKTDNFEELQLSLDDNESVPSGFPKGQSVESFLMQSVLGFIGNVDVSSVTYLLHSELLNLMIVSMSTQLRSPSGLKEAHPFIETAMIQEPSLAVSVIHRLLLNYIARPSSSFGAASYSVFSDGSSTGVLQRVSSAAVNLMMLPLSLFGSPSNDGTIRLLADSSLHFLLILTYCRGSYRDFVEGKSHGIAILDPSLRENFVGNPYSKALQNAKDVEFDRVDIEGNAHIGPLVRLPFAILFDTLGMCLSNESSVLLLYSLLHGNADFLEYVLVRTDLDTLLMPVLETLYNASTRTSNHIYMLLIILLILSQDSTFNASIHKQILPNVPWYEERRLHQISLGSLTVIVLIRTMKYNLSKMQDVYLHTNCLATLANMAPHVHRLNAYASQRLVSLFHLLSRKYTKLVELQSHKIQIDKGNSVGADGLLEDVSTELHIYTDFLRLVLEIINAILTYALPRNPEVVYAIMHRQEVFQPFKNHPRFHELLENVFTVLDFFNSRMDAQKIVDEWSVEKVLEVIITNCRSWRGDGMKMFMQSRFTYEQESHPEEFFIPYVWQLVLSNSGFTFDSSKINLFIVGPPKENGFAVEEAQLQNGDLTANEP
ncbi:hypothetical protein Drorol1_Dr00015486 [Drosera rotundifolia]